MKITQDYIFDIMLKFNKTSLWSSSLVLLPLGRSSWNVFFPFLLAVFNLLCVSTLSIDLYIIHQLISLLRLFLFHSTVPSITILNKYSLLILWPTICVSSSILLQLFTSLRLLSQHPCDPILPSKILHRPPHQCFHCL